MSDPRLWRRGKPADAVVTGEAPRDQTEESYGGPVVFESASDETIERVLRWAHSHDELLSACVLVLEHEDLDDAIRDVLVEAVIKAGGIVPARNS